MSTVRAAQMIYTRVEPAYSPQNKPGFQTVYKTSALSAEDIAAVEKRVQCFQPLSQPGLIRLQFFTLNSGQIVLTHTVSIVADPQIVDRDRRSGAFMAHCIVVNQAEFQKVRNNPFALFDRIAFLNTPEDMVAILGQATGKAPLLEIDIGPGQDAPFSKWSNTDLRQLVTLTVSADQLIKQRRSVLFYGEDAAIREALEITFYLTPSHQRLFCSFDTFVDRCATQPGLYWAVGASTRQGGSYLEVNASQRKVVSQVAETVDDKDMYLSWLKHATTADGSASLQNAYMIQLLAEGFATQGSLPLSELDEQACIEFWNLHTDRIMRQLEVPVSKALGKKVGATLCQYMGERYDVPLLLKVAASQSLNGLKLSEAVTGWLVEQGPDLPEHERKIIQDFARQSQDMRLLHLVSTMGEKSDTKSRDEALQHMSAGVFQQALGQLMNPISPVDFVVPAHLPLLLRDGRLNRMTNEQFLALVEAVVKVNAGNHLGSLAAQVGTLDSQSLAHVEHLIKKHSNVAPLFAETVRKQRTALGPAPKRLGLF
ncbi:hypothetical protein TFLX_03976 [Thermoflexales bacterium]|nr:hypothetical protein TFLX_03976 [Thermoflexales bacterium]